MHLDKSKDVIDEKTTKINRPTSPMTTGLSRGEHNQFAYHITFGPELLCYISWMIKLCDSLDRKYKTLIIFLTNMSRSANMWACRRMRVDCISFRIELNLYSR